MACKLCNIFFQVAKIIISEYELSPTSSRLPEDSESSSEESQKSFPTEDRKRISEAKLKNGVKRFEDRLVFILQSFDEKLLMKKTVPSTNGDFSRLKLLSDFNSNHPSMDTEHNFMKNDPISNLVCAQLLWFGKNCSTRPQLLIQGSENFVETLRIESTMKPLLEHQR